ncbi:MAG: hypothetical protein SNH56_06825, partial [Rikenellaceae bacterium]
MTNNRKKLLAGGFFLWLCTTYSRASCHSQLQPVILNSSSSFPIPARHSQPQPVIPNPSPS